MSAVSDLGLVWHVEDTFKLSTYTCSFAKLHRKLLPRSQINCINRSEDKLFLLRARCQTTRCVDWRDRSSCTSIFTPLACADEESGVLATPCHTVSYRISLAITITGLLFIVPAARTPPLRNFDHDRSIVDGKLRISSVE
jgi:hypothetical protein